MVHLVKIESLYYCRCRMVLLVKTVSVYFCRCSKVLQADIVCESHVITLYQDIADSLDNGDKIDALIDDFSKAFELVPHGRLLTEIAKSGVDTRVVVWIREFNLGRTQRVRVGGKLSAEVRVTSVVPQGRVLRPFLFLAYVNDICRNMESTIRLFAYNCVIYRKMIINSNMQNLQKNLDSLVWWEFENVMKINPSKCKIIRFTIARVKGPLNYSLKDTLISEASSCKYLGIILNSDLSSADQVNYAVKKTWKTLHFAMRIFEKGNSNSKSLAYISLVLPIHEYGVACWDPYREGLISALNTVQKKAAKFANHKNCQNFGVA